MAEEVDDGVGKFLKGDGPGTVKAGVGSSDRRNDGLKSAS